MRTLLDHGDDAGIEYLIREAIDLECEAAIRPLKALRHRRLYKSVATTFRGEITTPEYETIRELYWGDSVSKGLKTLKTRKKAHDRNKVLNDLEDQFDFPKGSMAMYFPGKDMNAKIADVRIHVGGSISRLSEWDSSDSFDAGHLRAQLARFHRLWRVHFVLDREIYEKSSDALLRQLNSFVKDCVLALTDDVNDSAYRIATLLTDVPDSPFVGRTVLDRTEWWTQGFDAEMYYPSGAPFLRAFFPRLDEDDRT